MSSESASPSSMQATRQRLMSIASHLRTGSGRMKVVVTRDLGPDAMPLLRERKELDLVVWSENRACERAWLLEQIPGAAGVLLMLADKVNEELLDKGFLKVVSTMSVGYEHVDLPLLAKRGVRLGYTPDVLTDAVADVTVMLALMASRNAKETAGVIDRGEWPNSTWSPFIFCGPQLSRTPPIQTRTAGFLGFGRIAQATLRRLVPFGFTHCVYVANPSTVPNPVQDAAYTKQFNLQSVRRVDIDTLASASDVVFVLAPGGDKTRHLVNEAFLRKMKKTAVLVNTARGTLVDSDALAKALKEGWIWAAGLDVVEGEPNVTVDHPLVKEPRCVMLPHIGSATFDTRLSMAACAARNTLAGVFGETMQAELELKGTA
ncbi:hypothetical protein NEOLEDRAFT_1233354 [Neolentinus lepideus HHB14362 ss-1]|uniref:Glyoxylate reductase n=1 Tax=Neolentinus lepideus HHB14362 ss-1 TaxID=1314782 RepID=A0A165UDT4_9AGAM|nr:hypothetical protein NEOLEDRAFT_1233354 [Neolentinus lepideus HHB14362 ss-1]